MTPAKNTPGGSDLIPGVAGALIFLGLFLFHLLPLWLTILLAIGVYVGVKLLIPAPKPEAIVVEPTESILASVRDLSTQIPAGSARVRLRNITDISESLLRYGSANPDKSSDSIFVVRQYLDSLRAGLRRYLNTLRLAPDSAQQSQETFGELLETVHDSLSHLHSELVENETADLTGDLRALNRTLQELDKVWINLGEKRS